MLTSELVVVFAPNWLGDAVMGLPALADVRRHFASARLVVAARASVASLFELVPGVDAVVTLQWRGRLLARRSLREDIATLQQVSSSVTGERVAILLPNSFATAWLASRSGFSERWGYARDWRRHLLTRAVRVPHTSTHQGRFYQHLVGAVGVASGPLEPQVDVPQQIRQQAAERVRAAGWDGTQRLVTMAPGAAYGTAKRWLPGHFAQVVADLAAGGVRTVLVGTRADADTIATIVNSAAARRAVPISLVGTTSLAELAGILALSSACVSNDSGAMHLAGAVGTPLVALFGPTRESETAPLTRPGGHRSVLTNAVWCRPCMLRECPLDHRCMTGLAPSQVTATVQALLS